MIASDQIAEIPIYEMESDVGKFGLEAIYLHYPKDKIHESPILDFLLDIYNREIEDPSPLDDDGDEGPPEKFGVAIPNQNVCIVIRSEGGEWNFEGWGDTKNES